MTEYAYSDNDDLIAAFAAQQTAHEKLIDDLELRNQRLKAELATMQWRRMTARDDSLPPTDMAQVEMLLVTKTDGEFIAMTTGDQFRRLAASGNPKIKDYYWRPFISPEADNAPE